ncbi:hypothetical protein [uncultured Sphingomonas sp.]|uniref:hypothetical protein n=1 Tax=uncultured Sphingomonas sp. TaxID=158754 RepID=UPI0037495329
MDWVILQRSWRDAAPFELRVSAHKQQVSERDRSLAKAAGLPTEMTNFAPQELGYRYLFVARKQLHQARLPWRDASVSKRH